jgi:hypothetical protein
MMEVCVVVVVLVVVDFDSELLFLSLGFGSQLVMLEEYRAFFDSRSIFIVGSGHVPTFESDNNFVDVSWNVDLQRESVRFDLLLTMSR